MSIAESIAPHLPYLRRYARSLTGSQQSGDNYVAAVLEALIADSEEFDKSIAPRVALYRTFTKVWNSLAVNRVSDDDVRAHDKPLPERRLESITPLPRQAFLLVSVEGFSTAEAAQVLDVTPAHVTELLQMAGAEIAEQLSADVLIIEDEPLIAMDLEALVVDIGHRVQGVARTHQEAVAEVNKKAPSLVLADIHLADGSSGLEAVNEILEKISVPVIFITAFPERLLTGTKPEPVFLITKPFEPAVVKAMISQSLFFGLRSKKSGQRAA
ncbi:response regulator [Hyphomicrobium sp.]|uniref:response regulator n=1 Tax=Hyphomicrobium sp. TaxID=82 RepID=UPI002D76F8E0|nr:response regulator [Hyphomicrobium sp.]HET6389032.1 response regulator [Hyphomicrobium sp.]